MNLIKKLFVYTMVFSMCMAFAPIGNVSAADSSLVAGTLVKRADMSAVYYLYNDGGTLKRMAFPNSATYFTWFKDFDNVVTVTAEELGAIPLGKNATYRPGTRLIKITTDPKVYAVEAGGALRWIDSEATATALYGSDWTSLVDDMPDAFYASNYNADNAVDNKVTATAHPAGTLFSYTDSSDIYYVTAEGTKRLVSEAGFTANKFNADYVITGVADTITYTSGSTITSAEADLFPITTATTTTTTTTGDLTVALAANTPASATYIRDTGAVVAQAVAPFLTLNFTASNDGDVKVTTLKLTRSGISSDTDLSSIYLYDGDTQLTENTSFASKVITFSNTNGLFTVSAGTTKTITVKADLSAVNSSVASIALGLLSASDVTTTGGTITGSFPMVGNDMAVATVADLGYVDITSATTFPATMDPGATDQELWRFTVTAADQDMSIERIKMTIVGTVAPNDLANFKLEEGGVQIGSTVSSLNASKEIIFDLSANPYKISAGRAKVIVLKGDVVSGSSRAFKVTIRKVGDFIVKDDGYGVYVAPLYAGAAFSLIDPDASGDGTNINSGTLTVSVADDSPSGNIASAATGVSLAKFTYKATGEDIKINTVRITVDEETGDKDLKNGKLYLDGVQVGSTDAVVTDETANLFTMSQIIPAGETKVFEYKADIVDNATGTGLAANQVIVVTLGAGTTDATGQSSLSSVATAGATARLLTVKTGLLSVAKNASVFDYTVLNPTGVVGATNKKVGSLTLTAGAGEAVTVTQVVIGDKAGGDIFGGNFQNLKLKHNDTELSATQGTLSTTNGADFTFTLSPAVHIAAGEQYVIDVYADVLTSATQFTTPVVGLEFVSASATGDDTSTDATTGLSATDLQQLVIASQGTLTVTVDSATPAAGQLVMGETDMPLAKLQFTAGNSEDVNVSRIEISDTTGNYNSSLSNIKLYDGTTQIGSTVASFDSSDDAEFLLATPWKISAGETKVLTVKASVNAYPNATSGGTVTLAISSNTDLDSLGRDSGTSITETVSGATGTAQDIYRTKLNVVKGDNSPSGSAVAGAGATVLEFKASADPHYDAVLNTVALSVSGSVDTTGTGDASIYKSTDLTTPLATESYVQDLVSISAAVSGQSLAVTGTAGDWNGIPMGATVLVNDTSVGTTLRGEVTAISSTVLTVTVVGDISGYAGTDVGVTYRPMQPGTGKLYFGAQSVLGADLSSGATSITVASTDGFAIGDTLTIKGYSAGGVAIVNGGPATIVAIPDATHLTIAAGMTLGTTIDYDYLSTAANAIAKGFSSLAVVYTNAATNNIGETIAANTDKTFVVKGDTTGGTSNETLRVDIATTSDLNWDDNVTYGITTDTNVLPFTGGTLKY